MVLTLGCGYTFLLRILFLRLKASEYSDSIHQTRLKIGRVQKHKILLQMALIYSYPNMDSLCFLLFLVLHFHVTKALFVPLLDESLLDSFDLKQNN